MSFATVQDWLDEQTALHFIADIDGDGNPDEPEIERALKTAYNEMDGWLAARYPSIPTRAHNTLKMHQIKIATHHLASTAQSSTDDIKDAWKSSIDYLKAISSGRADLPGTDKGGDLESGSGGVQMQAPDRIFSRESMKDF